MSVTFAVPLPPRLLSPNVRAYRASKWTAIREYRAAVRGHALAAMRAQHYQPAARSRVHLEFRVTQSISSRGLYHPADADNALAAFKAGIDGLRDSGIIAGDRAEQLELAAPQVLRVKPGEIWITVEAIA